MKTFLRTSTKSYYNFLHANADENTISWPCSEQKVIELYDSLLEPGEHQLRVPTMAAGRELLKPLIASMHFMHEAAILSVEQGAAQLCGIALYDELIKSGYLWHRADLEEFMCEFWELDFLWIEETEQLCQRVWYQDFRELINDEHFSSRMSIVTTAAMQ